MRASAAFLAILIASAAAAAVVPSANGENPRAVWQKRVVHAPAASPVFSGDAVWFVGLDRRMVSVDAATGDRRWRRNLPWPAALPPLDAGEMIVVAMGGPEPGLIGLARASGHERWRHRLDSPPVAIDLLEGRVLCATISGRVASLDPGSGEVRWERRMGAELITLRPMEGSVAVAGRVDSIWLLDAEDGVVRERCAAPGRRAVAPVAIQGSLLCLSYEGELLAISLLDGCGQARLEARGPYLGEIGAGDGSIALAATGGEIEAFGWPDLRRLWIVESGETISTGVRPGPSGWIVAAQSGAVRCYTADRGAPAWSLEFRYSISVLPAVDGRRLCVIDDRGSAVLYQLEAGSP